MGVLFPNILSRLMRRRPECPAGFQESRVRYVALFEKDSAFIDFLKAFEVHWSDDGSKISTCAFIVLDGTVVPGRFLHGEGTAFRRGVRVSRQTERPFVFQKIKGNGQ